jgi:hypothetical protein
MIINNHSMVETVLETKDKNEVLQGRGQWRNMETKRLIYLSGMRTGSRVLSKDEMGEQRNFLLGEYNISYRWERLMVQPG